MKKQGFTLIELMVVIVIMGVLAAVAVPKLFGMIAKSKASEVPTAAGSWVNLVDAYILEATADDVKTADWNAIGYSAPGNGSNTSFATENFTYAGGNNNGDELYWQATANKTLNECAAGGVWKMKAKVSGTQAQISDNSSTAACLDLTPAWKGLYRSSM